MRKTNEAYEADMLPYATKGQLTKQKSSALHLLAGVLRLSESPPSFVLARMIEQYQRSCAVQQIHLGLSIHKGRDSVTPALLHQ